MQPFKLMLLFICMWLGCSLLQAALWLSAPSHTLKHQHITCSTYGCSGQGFATSESPQSEVARKEKIRFCFVHFRLFQLCFRDILQWIPVVNAHTGEYTFFCAVCTCLWNASAALQFVWVETLHWMVEYLDSKQGKGHSEILSLFSEGIKKYVT